MAAKKKIKGVHVKGYYTRARVFGYLMLLVAVAYLAYYLYQRFNA